MLCICRRGGTVDTADSKSAVREDVRVQVSSPVKLLSTEAFPKLQFLENLPWI